jgi:hypothetical protein
VAFIYTFKLPPGYFTHISITTPIASALKNYYIELSRNSSGYFKPLLDPGGGFTSETAARRLQKCNGRYVTVSEVKRLQIYNGYNMQRPFPNGHKCPLGCINNGYVTAMAVGQRQRLYSGVRIFTGNYISSTPRELRA